MDAQTKDDLRNELDILLRRYRSYSKIDESDRIVRAYEFMLNAHEGQVRATGEPYAIHPLAVALILTELEPEASTLVAALLHDTVEDTGLSIEFLASEFGEEIAELVDGVTKLDRLAFSSKEEVQAENFRKMLLAMARDIRVVLIKLADRLHNMRTMKHLTPDRQQVKARETLDIYAPLAHRLGIYKWKWELEDLCLRYLDRDAFYELVGSISQKRSEREHYVSQIITELKQVIERMGIHCEIEGRPKHFYSIYRKMHQQNKNLDQIYDLFAARIIVNSVADCYSVLGVVHELYRPIPGRFKDYIAMPKPNMYQSLHTTVIGPKGMPFEVQIRTFAMHRTAEYGIAAHWKYKEEDKKQTPGTTALDEKMAWLRQLLDWQKDMRDAGEYMESLKNGLIAEEVFVFTPKGDVVALPAGAVPIDFAYNIHSGIGNRMYGAKVNGRIVPLTYELQNGDIVEILTSDKVHGPSRDWLKLVKSSSARSKINQWFKREMRDENIARGREVFEREMKKSGFTAQQLLKSEVLEKVFRRYTLASLDDLYSSIGYGGISAGKILTRLRDEYIKSIPEDERHQYGFFVTATGQVMPVPPAGITGAGEKGGREPVRTRPSKAADKGVIVKGVENCLVRLSRCCNPVPGDPIVGYVTRGQGVAVHRTDCSNVRQLLRDSSGSVRDAERASRLIDVSWAEEETGATYQVELRITAHDRRHLLADISNAIADEKISILSGQLTAMKDVTATIKMLVEVNGQNQLDRVIGRLKAIRDVLDVRRSG